MRDALRSQPTKHTLSILALALPALTAACGSSGGGSGGGAQSSTTTASGGGTGTSSTSATTTDTTTGSTTDTTSTTTSGPPGPCDPQCGSTITCAPGSEFCAGDAAPVDCALAKPKEKVHVCGVPLADPMDDLQRSSTVKEFAGSGPPALGCFAPGGYPAPPGASQKVTLSGTVRIVSHGCESKNVSIGVYTVKRTGGPDDGAPDQLVGTAVTTAADCTAGGVSTPDSDCGTKYLCKYSYPNVPTETELIVKTSGSFWSPMYEYNVYLSNAGVKNGGFSRDLRVLSTDDYAVLPQAAIGAPIEPGNGMILGEVHDCADVRLINAVVNVDEKAKLVTYTTANEAHPLPDLAQKGTSAVGAYLALDLAAGPVRVGAVGRVGGVTQTLGFSRVQVIPDAVSLVTFHGVLPFQVP